MTETPQIPEETLDQRIRKLVSWATRWSSSAAEHVTYSDAPSLPIPVPGRDRIVAYGPRVHRDGEVRAEYEVCEGRISTIELGPLDVRVMVPRSADLVMEITLSATKPMTPAQAEEWVLSRIARLFIDDTHGAPGAGTEGVYLRQVSTHLHGGGG